MGATTFMDVAKGKDAREAFSAAVADARHWNGHGGYTGSIAEKDAFVMIPFAFAGDADGLLSAAEAFAGKLIGDGDPRIDDKWGPAGCIALGDGSYLFFGWASS
jgi:hypothetical protein